MNNLLDAIFPEEGHLARLRALFTGQGASPNQLLGPATYPDAARDNPVGWQSTRSAQNARVGIPRGKLRDVRDVMVDRAMASPANPVNFSGSIIGPRAKTFPRQNIAMADRMHRHGDSAESILKTTGLMMDSSGRWMAEIPDAGMKITSARPLMQLTAEAEPNGFGQYQGNITPRFQPGTKLSDHIDHPVLFKNYPALRDVELIQLGLESAARGQWQYDRNAIALSDMPTKDLRSVLAHELGHAVQSIESFGNGTNPGVFLPKNFQQEKALTDKLVTEAYGNVAGIGDAQLTRSVAGLLDNPRIPDGDDLLLLSRLALDKPDVFEDVLKAIQKKMDEQKTYSEAYQRYRDTSGEQVANAIGRRVDLMPAQQKNRLFFKDFDPPYNDMWAEHPIVQMPPGPIVPFFGGKTP